MRMLTLTLFLVAAAFPVHAQPVACDATEGRGIVACVERTYPDKLGAGVSEAERAANMAFLRDRIIETARCAKLDVGLNCKRGNCNNISLDFVAWKHDGITDGVDIGAAYDDTAKPLKLMWHTYGPPNYGFPTYKAYGPVSCVVPPHVPDPPPSTDPPPSVDLGPILQQIDELKQRLAELQSQLQTENEARIVGDVALREDVELIKATPVPTMCSARGPLGIPVRCEIR